jgi:outer membrane protein assembly factor BamD (BamD/ComL family)
MKKLVVIPFLVMTFLIQLEAKTPIEARKLREAKYELIRPKAQEYHEKMMVAYQASDWNKVVLEAKLLKMNYPQSPLLADAYFLMGVAYYKQSEYEHANQAFTDYLKDSQNLRNFEEAVQYKYEIAKLFESGVKKRLFGLKKMPKILPAKEEAINVYNEVIAAMPRSDLACDSLFRKANLLVYFEEFSEAIDTYQVLIRRFPKSSFSPRSYVSIAQIYLKQCQQEFPDPSLIELAEINLKKFESSYPTEPLIEEVKLKLATMRGVFAEELYVTGNYFVKKKKYDSAYIYYKTILSKYSDTKYYGLTLEKIEQLKKKTGKSLDFEHPL